MTTTWLKLIAASLALHGMLAAAVGSVEQAAPAEKPRSVKVKIVEAKPPEPTPPPPEPPKPKPKPKKPPPKPKATERKPKAEPEKPVEIVQGLSKDSFAKDGASTVAAPVGNSLMVADEGKRLKPEDVGDPQADLSREAELIRSTVKTPEYTADALDVGLEGIFAVDVYVDESGNVTSAELARKIGYGMDEKVIQAAKQARFNPRRDRFGKALAGWAVIKFSLIIE